MKKKHNKSMKIAITSSVVIIALVGLSVFSLRSLADRKNDSELMMTSANGGANTSTAKLLTRAGETDAEYAEVSAPAAEETEEVYYIAEPEAEVLQAEIKDFVVVDSIVDGEIASEKIEEQPVSDTPVLALVFVEPETEAPVKEEPVNEEPAYQEPVYEEPVYQEPVYEEPVYQEPVIEEPAYQEPVYDDAWAVDSTVDSEGESDYDAPVDDENVWTEPSEDNSADADDSWVNDSVVDSWDEASDDSWSGNNDYNEAEYDSTDEIDYDDSDEIWEEDVEEDESDYSGADEADYDEADYDESDYDETEDTSSDYDESDYDDSWEDDSDYSYVASNASLGQAIVNYASQWVGVTPYVDAYERWTGDYYYNSLTEGTDCSGFTYLIYSEFGIYVPTGSDAYQYCVGTQISYDELLPGDIVVYRYGGHVAIYAGNDMIIHCANPESGTIYSSMWYSTPTAYVRVVY